MSADLMTTVIEHPVLPTSPFNRDMAAPDQTIEVELTQEHDTMSKNPKPGPFDSSASPGPAISSTTNVEELQRQKEELDRQIAEHLKAEKASVIQQIIDVTTQYNVTIEDLIEAMGGFKPKRKGVKATPKYRDPSTGTTWSGRGKEPTWMRGRDRDDFLIKED